MTSFDAVTPISDNAAAPAVVREIFDPPPLPGCPPAQLEMDGTVSASTNRSLLRMCTIGGSSQNLGERFEEGLSRGDDPDSPGFKTSLSKRTFDEDGDDQGHHHERPPSILTASAAGLINYMLMFGLSCAYGMIMFYDDNLAMHRGLGVKMCLSTAFFTGLMLAWKSEIGVAIGGTDLNPVVFLGGMVVTISEAIQEDLGLVSPGRRLGASSATVMCMGEDTVNDPAVCDIFHEKIRATVIFMVTLSSFILGSCFYCLGKYKLTRYVSYVPTSIMEAFLSCVGYKVFKYALKFCKYEPKQFIPAALIGVLLYFMKALHIGNPAVVIPTVLLLPLGCFYIYIFLIQGEDLNTARKDSLMFPVIDNINFWHIWTDSIGKIDRIDFKAVAATGSDLAIMVIVVILDCLLKISSTESKIPVTVNKDVEIKLHGLSNIMSVLTGSTVGYMQLKFNVINYGVVGNIRDRRGGFIYAILCGIGFFGSIEHFNYLPRFFLGMLLFFAGAGFVAENLWGSRKYLSIREWSQILAILAVFIITGQLLVAVVVGGLLTGMDFILRYAKVSCIGGHPLRGGEIPMVVRQPPLLQRNLQHIANNWLMVIRLKGYIFFASATSVVHYMKNKFAEEMEKPEYRRLRFIVFDCDQLDGMDASASKAMKKLVEEAGKMHIRVLWANLHEKDFKEQLITRTIVKDPADLYDDVTQAVDYVHKLAMDYRIEIHRRFMSLHPAFGLYRGLLRSRASFEPFLGCFALDIQRFGCPWIYCSVMQIKKRETVIHRLGDRVMDLFLVHSGAVGVFKEDPDKAAKEQAKEIKRQKTKGVNHPQEEEIDPWTRPGPHAVYKQGWFLNREMLIGAPTRHHAVALEDGEVLVWTERNWIQMARERPYMARAISKTIIKQQYRDDELLSMEIDLNSMTHKEKSPIDLMEDEEAVAPLRHRQSLRGRNTRVEGSPGGGSGSASVAPHRPRVSQVINKGKIFSVLPAAAGTGPRPGCPLGLGLPEEMLCKLVGIQTAQVLENFNLYQGTGNVEEDVVLPPMPKGFSGNLEIAFHTYCRPADQTITWANTFDALMFAGIFNSLLDKNVPPRKAFTKEQFMAVGHRAAMSPLSTSQVRKVRDIFERWDDDGNGRLDREQLISVFREVFHPDQTIEEVEGVSAAWGVGALERMEFLDFLCVFSRFMRIHEQDWSLLRGFHELMGKRQTTDSDCITAHDIMGASNGSMTVQHAQEMLWAVDWRNDGGGQGDVLPFMDLVGALIMNVDLNPGKLPPPPVLEAQVTEVMGFHADALRSDDDVTETPSFIMLRRATQSSPTSGQISAVAPEMRVSEDALVSEVEGLVQDLRDTSNYVGSRQSHILSVGVTHHDMSILESMLTRHDEIETAKAAAGGTPAFPRRPSHLGRSVTEEFEEFSEMENQLILEKLREQHKYKGCRASIYKLCEMPASSAQAHRLSLFMGGMIALSVMSLFLESLITPPSLTPTSASTVEEWFWKGLEIFFTALFSVEYLIRLVVCNAVGSDGLESTKTIGGFIKNPSNICDLVALLPFYIEQAMRSTQDGLRLLRTARLMKLIRLLRVTRVMKLTRLAQHGSAMSVLAGPVAMVMTVIWGIYLMNTEE